MTLRLLLAPAIGKARARARAELLEQTLGDALGEAVHIDIAEDYGALERQALESEAELVWAPPVICARLEAHARAILTCLRGGRASYHCALVGRRDEALELTALEGTRAAWVDPKSLGGYLLAIDHLESEGYDPETLFRAQHFLGSYPDALRAVVYEDADVTAVSVQGAAPEQVEASLVLYAGRVQAERLRPIAVTREAPFDALVLTEALSTDRAERLTERLVPRDGQRSPTGLCLALEADGFSRARPGAYEVVSQLVSRRRA